MKKWLPWILVAVMASWFAGTLQPQKDKTFAFSEFGKLPIVDNGRVQPIESEARNALLQLRGKQTLNLEPWKEWYEGPKIIPANEWVATVMMNPDVADSWPAFRIDHPELIGQLKLPEKDKAARQDGKHYSWRQIQPELEFIEKEVKRIVAQEKAKQTEPSQRTSFESAVMALHGHLGLYMRLKNTLQPQDTKNWPAEVAEYEALIKPGLAAADAERAHQDYDKGIMNRFLELAEKYQVMGTTTEEMAAEHRIAIEPPFIIPPRDSEASRDKWLRTGDVLFGEIRGEPLPPAVHQLAEISGAFNSGDVAGFNSKLAAYRDSIKSTYGKETKKSQYEAFFDHMEPFYSAMVIYVLAFILACSFWFNLSDSLRKSAFSLIVLAFVIHTTGLLFRMWLEGRPPVTNLYSSAIFIGWGAVILGLVLERFYRDGIGSVVASSMGFTTLIIAHNLALSGDTMEMMRAVLDTNFWLATHVVIVTLGYASTFVAGFLALVYILRGVFTKTLSEPTAKALARMVYGIVCFATLFSFVGTVLGGIWADQSWGRFWGWDPKENGALIIVLWNVLILHARWGGMIRERGLIVCGVVGNIVTSWSWFGVNMLGIGLHSYGFTDSAFRWLILFVVSQLVIIGLGLLPNRYWASFRGFPTPVAKPAGGGKTPARAPKPKPA